MIYRICSLSEIEIEKEKRKNKDAVLSALNKKNKSWK